MDVMSPELARAWQQYFRQKGGIGPTLPPELIPVVVIDDNSDGPYPPCRIWVAGQIVAATAGVPPRLGIQNVDGFPIGGGLLGTSGVPRSVVVVDKILIQRDATVAGDFFAGITHHNLNPIDGASQAADDSGPEKDPTPGATRPSLGNVVCGQRVTGAAFIFGTNNILPGFAADVLPHIADGPWLLGPGQILYVERNLANVGMVVAFRGRYYSAP